MFESPHPCCHALTPRMPRPGEAIGPAHRAAARSDLYASAAFGAATLPRQVTEHNESTQRQYALRNRAIAAGWPVERIRVIDCDLGKSASIAPAARDGFQQLVSEVALGKAGIVMGLEASRLARKSSEWHRLIELCGMSARPRAYKQDPDAIEAFKKTSPRALRTFARTSRRARR